MGDVVDKENGNNFSKVNLGLSSFKPQPALGQGLNKKLKNAEVYYGIFIPDKLKKQEDLKLIFTDNAECLDNVKRIPGARFKGFSTLIDAEKFVEYGPVNCFPTIDSIVGEKPNIYPSVKSQDLMLFRKAIEKGNVDYFEECVIKNPRYLVSSSDTPSIIKGGTRYNALHVACLNNQPYFCRRILSIISNMDFFRRQYPDDSVETTLRRSEYLVDLYLNTPDKGFNETPLHFASKLGSVGCVKVLISIPACDKNIVNKQNQKPIEIICDRVQCSNKNIVQQITDLLGDCYYIPLYRAEDNCLPPQIGAPTRSPVQGPLSNDSPIGSPACSSSPISPSLKVRGLAGPMSPQMAETFYSRWKRSVAPSPKNMRDKISCIRITDHEKGLERVARDLASELCVDFLEYWDFLGTFMKLDTEEGLSKLEKYLQTTYKQVVLDRSSHDLHKKINFDHLKRKGKSNTSEEFDVNDSFSAMDSSINLCDQTQFSSTSIGEICRGLEALQLNMSLSPNPKANSSISDLTFNEMLTQDESYLHSYVNSNSFNESLNTTAMDGYNFVIQSISISSEKVLHILREASDNLELHVGQNFNVTLRLKKKIKKEIVNLRKVIISHLEGAKEKYDLSFVHILLAANVAILLPESVTCDKVHLLLMTINTLQKNIKFFEGSSSEEEEESRHENINDGDAGKELECFVKAFAKSLSIVNSLVKKGEEGKLSKADLEVCECGWVPVGGGTLKLTSPSKIHNLSASPAEGSNSKPYYKYSHAHSFLSKLLFTEKREKKPVFKQLIFNEEPNFNHLSTSNAHEESHHSEDDDDDAESFVSAVSSVDEAGMVTPEEAINVYIRGVEPSKVDVDVLLAIDGIEVNSEKFPYTSMWLKLVSSHSKNERERWSSPCCRRNLVSSSHCGALTERTNVQRHRLNFDEEDHGQSPRFKN